MDTPESVVDLLPPHEFEAEAAVLGSVMLDNAVWPAVAAMLGPQDFYGVAHRKVFEAIGSLAAEGRATDLVTLAARCSELGVLEAIGGPGRLVELLEKTPSAANAEMYAAVVADRAARRRQVAAAAELTRLAMDPTSTAEERAGAAARGVEASGPRSCVGPRPLLVRAADVAPQQLRWLWPDRVPLGKLTVLVGDPGRGKSLVTLDMAARVTRGRPWPDAPDAPAPVGNVVLLSAEDDLADTIRPRLDAAGADPERVVELRAVGDPGSPDGRAFSLSTDLSALQQAIERTGDVRLVVIDPLSAYLGRADSHNNAGVRSLLSPLAALAERTATAVVAITHLNKNATMSIMYRATGSLAFVAAARAVWAALPDGESPGRLLLVPVKCNLVGKPTGMGYRIVPSPEAPSTPLVAWDPEPVGITAVDALDACDGGPAAQRRSAVTWLRDLLSDGPRPYREVESLAREAGIAKSMLLRAKRAAGVVAYPPSPRAPWNWRLPDDGLPHWSCARKEREDAASHKPQAASDKPQAASDKRQAASDKPQAASPQPAKLEA